MKLFDTHCHFESGDKQEIAACLARAKAAGVEKILAVGGSDALNASALIARREGKREAEKGKSAEAPLVEVALGYDRDQHDLPSTTSISDLDLVPAVAVGEIGLDYHYSPETREKQIQLFSAQLELARELDLPVIIHTREAWEDTLAVLKKIPSRGIIHSFTGTPEEAKSYLDLGFFISFSGIVTFKKADNVREAVKAVPDDRILIETDSPYLAPVPMRGQANEPAFVRHTCEFLAKFRGMDAEEFAELTFTNGERILGSRCEV